jgi:large subunit ribosomal protein L23
MEILIRPLITEKITAMGDKLGRYGFVVAKKANKLQIRKAVEEMYGVNVTSINTLIVGGKDKTRYTKAGMVHGRSSSYKKAIVTLAEGEKIDFYSNI